MTRFAFALESHDARNFNYWPAGKAQCFDGLREPEVVAGDPDVAWPRQPFRESPLQASEWTHGCAAAGHKSLIFFIFGYVVEC